MSIVKRYEQAKELYKTYGVDVDKALEVLDKIKISIHCWQGDDIDGFVNKEATSGGIMVTGNYKGKARTPKELRDDLELALSLIPGKHKINLHSIYAEDTNGVDLDSLEPKHFNNWIKWAKKNGLGLDFNPTLFSHPKASSGLTLSHPDASIRKFWIEHVKRTRKIADYISKELNMSCVHNIWIPDGYKDYPYHRLNTRNRLIESLDTIYNEGSYENVIDTVESKLFGLGVEGYTVGSHEFYLSYAVSRKIGICLDSGHFHPTETISDKLSAVAPFIDNILLHVSRPMRWDSDHVVLLNDELNNIANAIIRDNLIDKIHIGLDYFDASINRIAAWVVGVRNTQKAILRALLEPNKVIKKAEENFDFTKRMVLTEELKALPYGIIYDYYCYINKTPDGSNYYKKIEEYEKNVLDKRE